MANASPATASASTASAPAPPSIRRRLSAALLGIAAAWSLAVALAVGMAVHHQVDSLLDNGLQESAEILYGLLAYNVAQLPLDSRGALPAPPHDERLIWQIVGAGGTVLLRSHQAPDQPLLAQPTRGLASVGGDWRVYGLPFGAAGGMLYVAQPGESRHAAQTEAGLVTTGVALLVGLLAAAWLRTRLKRELAPVAALSAAVAGYDPLHDLAPLTPATRAELVPMHQAISALGARLAGRVASERAFSAHAAHALRTPLAGMVAQLALAQRESPPAAQPRLKRTREAADRLQRVVSALLTLFRAGGEVERRTVDLTDLVAHLPLEALALRVDGQPRISADPDLLAAALLNLLDNAQRHGATVAVLQVRHADGGQQLRISDDGSGLDDALRLRLQQALAAQDYERPVGLGLMLADLVARAHGGALRLLPSAQGGVVELWLGASGSAAPAGGTAPG